MSIDLRPFTTNATAELLSEIAADHALRAEILWAFVVILHFAALLPLDPVFVHVFVCLLSWAGGSGRGGMLGGGGIAGGLRDEGMLDWVYGSGRFADCLREGFYDGLRGRLSIDEGVGWVGGF
jgi:hypothetical protein